MNQECESERKHNGHSQPQYRCAREHGSASSHLCSHGAALYQSLAMLVAKLWQRQLWGCGPLWTLLLSFISSTWASIPVTQVLLHNLLTAMASTSISVSISGFTTSKIPWFVSRARLWLMIVSGPDPPRTCEKEGLVFWTTFLVTWGGVKWGKECNYCIPPCIACSV